MAAAKIASPIALRMSVGPILFVASIADSVTMGKFAKLALVFARRRLLALVISRIYGGSTPVEIPNREWKTVPTTVRMVNASIALPSVGP